MKKYHTRLNASDIVKLGVLSVPFLVFIAIMLVAAWCMFYQYEFVVKLRHIGLLCIVYTVLAHILLSLLAFYKTEGSENILCLFIAFNTFFFPAIIYDVFSPFSFLNTFASNLLPEEIQSTPVKLVFFVFIYQLIFVLTVRLLKNLKEKNLL